MPHYPDPRCTECGQLSDKLLIMIKSVSYSRLGQTSKVVKSRAKAWLCPTCLDADPDWHLPPYTGPGHTSASRERIKARREQQ